MSSASHRIQMQWKTYRGDALVRDLVCSRPQAPRLVNITSDRCSPTSRALFITGITLRFFSGGLFRLLMITFQKPIYLFPSCHTAGRKERNLILIPSQLLDAESAGGEGRGSKELLDPRKKKITRMRMRSFSLKLRCQPVPYFSIPYTI